MLLGRLPASKTITSLYYLNSRSLKFTRTMSETINIEIISDNVCPWCYVGKKNLEKAIENSPQYKVNVTFKPFFLRPDTPVEGMPMDVLRRQYPNFSQMEAHLQKVGKAAGIDFISREKIPNTLSSHRLVYYAQKNNKQDEVIAKLFRSYFEEGKDIGNHQILADIGQAAGLDGAAVKAYLDSDEEKDIVKQEALGAVRKNVSGVPHFTLSKEGSTKKLAISGGQQPQAFVEAFGKL